MEDDWNPPSPPTSRTSWAQQWWALGVARGEEDTTLMGT